MPHEAPFPYVREILVFLAIAAILAPLFHRARVSPVLGFLIAGVAIGPHGLGAFSADMPWLRYVTYDDAASVRTVAEFGIVFLLFVIGLEMSFERLWSMRRLVLGLGATQVSVTALVIGAIAYAWGNSPAASVLIGASFALSSTAVVMAELVQRGEFPTLAGRATFSVLLFQDLAVVPLLILVPALAGTVGGSLAASLAIGVATALAAAAGIWALGRLVLRPLFRLAAASRAPEFFVAVTLLTAIAASAGTASAGMSPALGAFLAGMLLADTEFRHQIHVDIEPFKGLLMGLFFISVGMSIDLRAVADLGPWVAASVVGLIAIKTAIAATAGRLFGLQPPVALHVGLLLGQGGEFALLVVSMAMNLGVMPTETGQFMLIVTAVSMLVTPGLAVAGQRAAAWLERHAPPPALRPDAELLAELNGHVVIAGFGRVGQSIAGMLAEEGVPYVAVDRDPVLVAHHRACDEPVYFGDGRRGDVLARVGAERARAIVLTLDEATTAEQVIRQIRRRWPDTDVYARARDREHARVLERAGATRTVPDLAESSLQMGAVLLTGLGVPSEAVATLVERARDSGYPGL